MVNGDVNRWTRRKAISLGTWGIVVTCFPGCGKRSDTGGAPPATRATADGLPRPQLVVPTETRLLIDGQPMTFPAPQAVLQATSPLSLAVFSEKGPETGSRYFIDMTLDDVEDLAALDGAAWQLMRGEERTDDLLTIISIDGGAEQFQPQEVTVRFAFDGKILKADLTGRWGHFGTREAVTPDHAVLVTGTIVAGITADE